MSRYNLKEKNVAGIHAAPQPLKLLEGGFGNNEFGGKSSIASLVHPCCAKHSSAQCNFMRTLAATRQRIDDDSIATAKPP
jgi:hypothetical protein